VATSEVARGTRTSARYSHGAWNFLSICRPHESEKELMMKRRDLLRTLGAVGAVTAVGRLLDPAAAGGQSFPAVSGRSTTDNLASRLAASIQKHKVPGASAAVFRAGQWEVAAAGVTNVTTGVDVTAETVMHIGSITKVLNATLLMQLVDEGRVELAAPLKRYLPDFQVADRDATELITVEMLLNHTCGIDGEYFPDAGPDAERIEDVIPRIARQGQIHAPGAELSYCNSGAVLAGYLAQRLLGKSWYTLIEEQIFEPLQLQHSVVQPADALLHRATVGHFLNKDRTNTRTSFAFLNPSFAPAGATAMLAAKDLATFALAHVNDGVGPNGHRLLSAASARRMQRQSATWRGVAGGGSDWLDDLTRHSWPRRRRAWDRVVALCRSGGEDGRRCPHERGARRTCAGRNHRAVVRGRGCEAVGGRV
jgi:CubicO group peptidase (beta-lactamase class C family)